MIIYREMQSRDIKKVYHIDQCSFKHNWSLDSYQKEIDNLLANYIVAEIISENNNQIIGFGGYWLVIDEAHITNIAVLKDYRNKGVGQGIFNKICQKSALQGAERMTLEVREDNYGAISFYKKNNFTIEGTRFHYYGENQHALIMWRSYDEK